MLQTREHTRASFSLHEIFKFVKTVIIIYFMNMTSAETIFIAFPRNSAKMSRINFILSAEMWLISWKKHEFYIKDSSQIFQKFPFMMYNIFV